MSDANKNEVYQSSVKNQNTNIDDQLLTSEISTNDFDQPLLIVLDEDNDDDDENFDRTTTTSENSSNNVLANNEEQKSIDSNEISEKGEESKSDVKNLIEPSSTQTNKKSKVFRRLQKSSNNQQTSNKFVRTVVIDTSFGGQTPQQQQQQQRNRSRRKKLTTSNSTQNMSDNNKNVSIDDNTIDSILSNISFDNISNILTVSRMGSIYYCVEDLYLKVFSTLCTLDDFTNLLLKSEIIILKQATLSEKISIEQQVPNLKQFNPIRYRLLSINSSDYLVKLKQVLTINKKKKCIDQIIDEMRAFKQTSTSILSKNKVLTSPMSTTKCMSTDDDNDEDDEDEPRKRLKIVTKKNPKLNETSQFGIFIQNNGPVDCNIYATNNEKNDLTISSLQKNEKDHNDKSQSEQSNLTEYQPVKLQACSPSLTPTIPFKRRIFNSYSIDLLNTLKNSSSPSSSLRGLHRSKSFTLNKEEIKRISYRSSSLPSMKIDIKENIKLNIPEAVHLTDENYSMPMIINIEENVQVTKKKVQRKSRKAVTAQDNTQQKTTVASNRRQRKGRRNSQDPVQHSSQSQNPLLSHSYSQHSLSRNNISPVSTNSSGTIHHPHSSIYQTPYNPSPQESYPLQNIPFTPISSLIHPTYPHQTINNHFSTSNYHDTQAHFILQRHTLSNNTDHSSRIESRSPSSATMPIMRKPNYYPSLTSEQQTSSSPPCLLPCCSRQSMTHPLMNNYIPPEKLSPNPRVSNERINYQQYPTPPSLKFNLSQCPNSLVSINRKQRRMESTPYPPSTGYFPPPSSNIQSTIRFPYPPNPSMNRMACKTEAYRPIPPVVVQNSSTLISPPNTPNELTLPNIRTRSIDLQQAIAEHSYCDMDKIPKLVVRHTKTYLNKTIDTMGQLFPTWFSEPDYRCIHCFGCDHVFTPQEFMTHVDDEQLLHEQPLNMTSIQLLTSEKMSEYKVGLWNQFCTNLTIYAREGRISGFLTNRSF